jgi:hypothetical protein
VDQEISTAAHLGLGALRAFTGCLFCCCVGLVGRGTCVRGGLWVYQILPLIDLISPKTRGLFRSF